MKFRTLTCVKTSVDAFGWKLSVFFFASLLVALQSKAQLVNQSSFHFLNIPQSARLAGLGGVNVSLADTDVNFFYSNPALSGDTLQNFASAGYQFYVADIGHATLTYAPTFKSAGMITFSVQHLDYGTIKGFDASGIEAGEFTAQETALAVSKNHQVGNYRFGVTMKGLFSSLAGYNASALVFDVGGLFIHPEEDFTIGLAIRNLGIVFSDFSSSANSTMPFDVQIGTTFKPEHMPVRFSLSAYNFGTASYSRDDADGTSDENTVVKVLKHVNVGGEILVHKYVNVLLGYNYLNHRSLKLENGGGGAGLSLGFCAKIKTFDFVFSRTGYVAGNAAYSFTLASNIKKILKRH